MTFTGVAPGPVSMAALAWLARVGASPAEPLQLVMGCSERVAYDHVRRLQAAGLVRRVPMRRGDGSLIVLTRHGALAAGQPATRALRSVGPTMWAHATACAWVSAWLQLRNRSWAGEREVLEHAFWRLELLYRDHRGTVQQTHRPDLAVRVTNGLIAIEVELQRKAARRQRGICAMYKGLTDAHGPLLAVIYVTDRNDVSQLVERTAAQVGLREPELGFREMHTLVDQTYAAADEHAAIRARSR
jgi:hypothetical protein